MQGRQVGVHVLDELGIDARRHIGVEDRRFQAASELVHVLVEDVGLDVGVQGGAQRALEVLVPGPEGLED